MPWQKRIVITLTMSISAVAMAFLWFKRHRNHAKPPETQVNDEQIVEAQTGVIGSQADVNGDQTQTGLNGGQPQTGLNGGQPQTGLNGGQAQTGLNGGQPQTGLNGGQPQTGLNGGQAQTGLNGGQPQTGLNGGQPQTGLNGGQSQTGLNGGQAQTSMNRDQRDDIEEKADIKEMKEGEEKEMEIEQKQTPCKGQEPRQVEENGGAERVVDKVLASRIDDIESEPAELEETSSSKAGSSITTDDRKLSFDEETLSDDSSVSSTALQSYTLTDSFSLGALSDSNGEERQTLEIEFPQALCGRLIGRKGKNVKIICEKSGAKIHLIPQSPGDMSTQRIISITGTQPHIQSALEAIHQKFPSVPLSPLNQPRTAGAFSKSCNIFAQLPDSPTFDVVVTHVVSAGHFFVNIHNQQSNLLISQLGSSMMECYSPNSYIFMPPLTQPVNIGMYCALPTYEGWCRAQIVGLTGNLEEVDVKYLDYGNIGRVSVSILMQLRADFLSFPFQAIECFLANVVPKEGESTFSLAANAIFEELVYNVILSAHFTCYKNGHPCLELYRPQGIQNLFINRELVNRGLSRWSET